MAEARALLVGLEYAWNRRVYRLVVEVDSEALHLIVSGESTTTDRELYGVVQCCMNLLHMPWEVKFNSVKRGQNKCADGLAKLSYMKYASGSGEFWVCAPDAIQSVLLDDLM